MANMREEEFVKTASIILKESIAINANLITIDHMGSGGMKLMFVGVSICFINPDTEQ